VVLDRLWADEQLSRDLSVVLPFAARREICASAQDDHRAGRVRDDVLTHRAKQHAGEAPVSA
jgi:hypothetical protein